MSCSNSRGGRPRLQTTSSSVKSEAKMTISKIRYVFLLASAIVTLTSCLITLAANINNQLENVEQDINKIEWWKKTNFYHIYIRSFKDTDGNGQGDIRGIIEKLDYIKSLGVETLLLSPFYSSPMKDGGYDIDDYTAMNPLFGSMEDFENLLSGLKQRSMRLVVDFVPNHSSNQHKWFKCSERALIDVENCGKYKDYYVWSNSTRFNNSRPTNWISLFGGETAWRWSDIRKEFYLHQFLPEQPDLNLRNPLVREEFKEIARFWLRKGVDGLRVDAVLHFLEDTINWRDEPTDPMWRPHWDPYDRLLHIYTRSMSESATIVKDWFEVANEQEFRHRDPVIITEAYDSIPKLVEYYGKNEYERYTHMPFDFELFKLNERTLEPNFVEKTIVGWLNATRELNWPDERGAISPWTCWVTGNHDNKRPVNRVGDRNADVYKWIAYLAPGVPVAYYGDEIGMHDANFNSIPLSTVHEGEPTRLIFRSPMAWNSDEPAGGFSTSHSIWMPMNINYKTNNVESFSKSNEKNHLNNFIQLQEIRKNHIDILTFGDLVFFKNRPLESSMIFAMARTHERFGNLLLLANFDTYEKQIVHLMKRVSEFRQIVQEPPKNGKILMLNYLTHDTSTSERHLLREGEQVDIQGLVLAPNQAVIIKY